GGDLHRVVATGGIDVAHGSARGAGDRLGGTVASVDGEGKTGRPVHRGRVGRREGEGARLAADAVGGAGDACRRCDVVHNDRGVGGAYAAILVRGAEADHVGAIALAPQAQAPSAPRAL